MTATPPCVRCSMMPEDHPSVGWPVPGQGFVSCPSYVAPAPWWMRAATKLLDAISRRFVR